MNQLMFARPEWLWGLFAASLPLIIHLINRHRARRRPFAAIDFLLRVKRRTARRILLRHILLLIIRTLLIAALVLAAAGPMLRPELPSAAPGPVTTALVVDRSFSMQARPDRRTWLEDALDKARAFVRGMPTGDHACAVAAGDRTQLLTEACTDARSTLLDALDGIEPAWGRSDLTEAMELAAAALARSPTENHRILLLTDACAHAFRGTPRWPDASSPPEVLLEDVTRGGPRDNLAVTAVEQSTRGRYLEVAARFSSWAQSDRESLPAEILLGDKSMTRGFVDLPAGKSTRKVFNLPVPGDQRILGQVVLTEDALPEDNRRPFLVSGRQMVRALLVDGDMRPVLHQDELFYLEHALSPSGLGVSGISFTTVTPERFREEMLEGTEVVYLANVRELDPEAAAALRRFVSSGGGLFVSLGDRVDTERLNAILADLLPWPLRDIVALGPADMDGVHRQGMAFADMRLDHPVLSPFAAEGLASLQAVRTWKAAVVEPGQGGSHEQVLLRYANGAPALLEGTYRGGRVLLFTSTLDRDWTSWPARASFLPFLQQATSYLSGRLGQLPPPEVIVGEPVSIPLGGEADGARVVRPDGSSVDLGPADVSEGKALFRGTEVPGWYAVEWTRNAEPLGSGSIPGLIVLPPAEESDLTPVSPEQLQRLVGEGTRLTLAGAGDTSARSKSMTFLLLALLLVLCEAFLIRR